MRALSSLLASSIVLVAACRARGPGPGPGGGGSTGGQDSRALQAIARDDAARFARAVAEEARTARLEVSAVAPEVFLDRGRGAVYVLRPMLVALDLESGTERWRLADVSGTALFRVGTSLAVVRGEGARRREVAFVDPDVRSSSRTCAVAIPSPVSADRAEVTPFARAGKAFVLWQSRATGRQGGPPPGEGELAREEAARSCGVVAVDPASCAATPRRIEEFFLSPPRREVARLASAGPCRYLSPGLDMPAVAASVARPPADAAGVEPTLHVVIGEPSSDVGPCLARVTATLEARSANGDVRWRHPLPERTAERPCPGPP